MEVRILTAGDPAAAVIHDRLAPQHDVLAETRRGEDFLWAVLVEGDTVVAAHRALVGHGRLYLRGVFSFRETGFATAYTLARYLLGEAHMRGISRSHVWVETTGRERRIAELLGATTSSTPLHRYRIPVEPRTTGGFDGVSGTIERQGAPRLDWLVDRSTTVLFGPPDADGLPGRVPFAETIDLPWAELVATPFVELPVPAIQITSVLELLSRGAKRMSRCTVRHGAIDAEATL